MEGKAGRLAGEVDLVLATLRVAKTAKSWQNAKEWEVISRPTPTFVSQLKDKKEVEAEFLEMISPTNGSSSKDVGRSLQRVREVLSYDASSHSKGLPAILLGRLPRELVDVLILFAVKMSASAGSLENRKEILCAFVLHWLLFVSDDIKAAWRAYQKSLDKDWILNKNSIRNLIEEYEKDGVARFIPRQDKLSEVLGKLRKKVEEGDHQLRTWAERFTAADSDGEGKPGEALRVLSTNHELVKRALMWLQRDYITEKFPNYDPTSDRDDDLPIDLDHLIPSNVFGFDWRGRNNRLQDNCISDNCISDNFRWQRFVIGNSLGNFRWLAASDNRSRGKGDYTPIENNGDLVSNPNAWNELIDKESWSKDDIANFQRFIDLRALELYEKLLGESGIEDILP